MKLPYVINNQSHKLADVLNQVMQECPSIDATCISLCKFCLEGRK